MTEIPEYYGDIIHVRTGPWGVAITLSVGPPKEDIEGHDVCILRLSHETAKILAMILRSHLKKRERETGSEVSVPVDTVNALELGEEAWP